MLRSLTRAVEARDPYARGHAVRVASLAETVAVRLGWDGHRLLALRVGSLLHDVGKIAIAEAILVKPGPLTSLEIAQVRTHPAVGARLLGSVPAARPGLACVLYHHERWDGDGYPTGRARRAIPLEARLLAIADSFDAMTSPRPYRRSLARDEALAEVERCAGTQFDPVVARVFVEAVERGVKIAAVG
jgi:HD-GYP domain-containing protein (c-di-GMP phosphodiesterase class II)